MLKKEVLAVALNVGNESNLEKMTAGEACHEANVWTALDRLMTADDWKFVQGIWDTIDSLWPRIEALEKRVSGVAPGKVQTRASTTRHSRFLAERPLRDRQFVRRRQQLPQVLRQRLEIHALLAIPSHDLVRLLLGQQVAREHFLDRWKVFHVHP